MRDRVAKARNGTGPQGGLFIPPSVDVEVIGMPGNQGGSNFGTTAANPQKGYVFVVGVNQVALLKLEDVTKREQTGQGATVQAGRAVYAANCQVCHGDQMQGVGAAPSLVGVGSRMADDAIRAVITGGRGLMRPVDLSTNDLTALVAMLKSGPATSGRRGAAPPVFPAGPVVASGGAPMPELPARGRGPLYPGVGGNAGNAAYPTNVEVPPSRYMSEYGVMASATKPPYTTLTAYDLNTGDIKWQVPNGDHAPTMAAGGPANSGGLAARNGMVATKGGLVFHAGGDGKFRAYDDETGKVLWTGTFAGNAPGVPVSYESKGRQYVVLISNVTGNGQGEGGAAAAPTTGPSGMVAFALPKR